MYICFCVYARHAGFVREVSKDSERDFTLVQSKSLNNVFYSITDTCLYLSYWERDHQLWDSEANGMWEQGILYTDSNNCWCGRKCCCKLLPSAVSFLFSTNCSCTNVLYKFWTLLCKLIKQCAGEGWGAGEAWANLYSLQKNWHATV